MPTIQINLTHEQLQQLSLNGQIVINFGQDTKQKSTPQCSTKTTYFLQYIQQWADSMVKTGNLRTAETYRSTQYHFSRFRNGVDIALSDITPTLVEQYQSYLRSQGLTMNTVSFLMRTLRSIYNKGVKQGLTIDRHPFNTVYTGNATTQKRALTLEDIRRIKELVIDDGQKAFARDMFLLSFYLRGMAFVDMAYLKPSDIVSNHLYYKRHKTGQPLTILWEKPMEEIVDRYKSTATAYLLPIIRKVNGKERNQYRNHQTHINKHLKEIARLAGIDTKLTMYVARHSWATIARNMQVPMNVISQAMGHTNERTTEIYIRSVDTNVIDQANRAIIDSVSQDTRSADAQPNHHNG